VLLAQLTLDGSGYASAAAWSLAPGAHAITAYYRGDANFAGSTGTLTETINGPVLSLSATALNFSSPLKIAGAPQTVTLSNTGNGPLTIGGIVLSGLTGYSIKNNTCLSLGVPAILSGGNSCSLDVTFQPTIATMATQRATLTVKVAAPGISQAIALTGALVAPTYSLSANTLSFGNQLTGAASSFQSVTITNTSPLANLTITGLSVSWTPWTHTCGRLPATLAPGAACTVNVAFRPTTAGPASGNIHVVIAGPGTSGSVSLSGTGVAPIQVAPSAGLAYGAIVRGQTRTLTLVLINPAKNPAFTGLNFSFSGSASFSVSSSNPGTCGTTLAGGPKPNSCTLRVVYAPATSETQYAPDLGTLTITGSSAGVAQTRTVPLLGTPR
jgi:hypothetical protein